MPKEQKEKVLEFTKGENLPQDTIILQANDGTTFYRTRYPPDRLFVRWKFICILVRFSMKYFTGKEIAAKLPGDCAFSVGAHGNSIYFKTNDKIYEAIFTAPDDIAIRFLRERLEGEQMQLGGLCTRQHDGLCLVYRMCDDPEDDAIFVDRSYEKLCWADLMGVQSGRAFYEVRNLSLTRPTAGEVKPNVILIETPSSFSRSFVVDSFVYIFENNSKLHVLNTEIMEFLPPLTINCDIDRIGAIAGVHKGLITVQFKGTDGVQIMSALLPIRYILPSIENQILIFTADG